MFALAPSARAAKFAALSAADRRGFYLHAATGYAASFTGSLVFRKKGMSTAMSVLTSTLLSTAVFYSKEKFLDNECSSTDMAANLVDMARQA